MKIWMLMILVGWALVDIVGYILLTRDQHKASKRYRQDIEGLRDKVSQALYVRDEQQYFIVKDGKIATSLNHTHQESGVRGTIDFNSFGFAETYRKPLTFNATQAVKYITDCDDENCYMLPVNGKSAVSLFMDGKTK